MTPEQGQAVREKLEQAKITIDYWGAVRIETTAVLQAELREAARQIREALDALKEPTK